MQLILSIITEHTSIVNSVCYDITRSCDQQLGSAKNHVPSDLWWYDLETEFCTDNAPDSEVIIGNTTIKSKHARLEVYTGSSG